MAAGRAYGGEALAGEIQARLVVERGPDDLLKAVRGSQQEAMKQVGVLWHQKMLDRHFDRRAYALYQYQPRDPYYERRKARVKHTNRPLFWSGTLFGALKGNVQFVSTPKSVTVRMSGGPRWLSGYLAFRGKKGTGPDKRKEITRVARAEYKELAEKAGEVMREAMEKARATQESASTGGEWLSEWG